MKHTNFFSATWGLSLLALAFLFVSCGGGERSSESESSSSPPKENAEAAKPETASPTPATKEAYYAFTAPEAWNKPVKAGEVFIYSVRQGACTNTLQTLMLNPKNGSWVEEMKGFSLDQYLSHVEQDLAKKKSNTILGKGSYTANGAQSGYVEYAEAEGNGKPATVGRKYVFVKDGAAAIVWISATKICWDKWLPEGEKALEGMKML